jgi:hypothetical protein
MTVKDQLNQLVREMIQEHTGGTEFFDALDAAVRSQLWFSTLERMASQWLNSRKIPTEWIATPCFVVSGKFGLYFREWYEHGGDLNWAERGYLIVVNGSLRFEPVMDLSTFDISGGNFIFLDDSFFGGRTRDKIKTEIERNGGNFLHTFVVYDGAKEKDPDVTSLYRYWDHHE